MLHGLPNILMRTDLAVAKLAGKPETATGIFYLAKYR